MLAKRLTPILNVSNIGESFAWFEKLGRKKAWDWGVPPDFGGVCSGDYEIFLCENGQGGRGNSDVKMTFGPEGDESADKGVWMCILVEDVDAVYVADNETREKKSEYGCSLLSTPSTDPDVRHYRIRLLS